MKISQLRDFLKSIILYENIVENLRIDFLVLNTNLVDKLFPKNNICFVAIKGQNDPLEKFLDQILKINPSLILSDENCNYHKLPPNVNLLVIKNLKDNLTKILKHFYKIENLNIFGITGTNGKTTITTLLYNIFSVLSQENEIFSSSLIGTIKYSVNREDLFISSPDSIPLTTPDICTLYYLLNLSEQKKCYNVFMEVSSHSLDQERIKGLDFKITAFTNLTKDHLDYHKTMKNYFQAKKKLFTNYKSDFSIINTNNKYGKILYETLKQKRNLINFKISNLKTNINFLNSKFSIISTFKLTFTDPIKKESITEKIQTDLIGKYNFENLSIVYIASYLFINYILKIEKDEKKYYLEKIKSLLKDSSKHLKDIARLELVNVNPLIFVDYAHTPDALKNVLKTLRNILEILRKKSNQEVRLISVFGAGGNRDKTKRPLMGKVASKYSDIIILTSDNPRNENPLNIIKEIKKGIPLYFKNLLIEVDREKAIHKAIELSNPYDIILIAGKGHENYQIIGNQKLPFNDKEIVNKIIKTTILQKNTK